ncbi:MAG: LOG family protein [Parachlamydiaceae bacterium]|nr:LOG family protein [Parachlamydiaceae bacterium]
MPNSIDVHDPIIVDQIQNLIKTCGGDPDSFSNELISQMIQNSLKMVQEGHDMGQLKLMSRALKEMRYAYRVFNRHKEAHCVSIFGSARTPETHLDYIAAQKFSAGMAKCGWMCITGAANGIMKAGLEGPEPGLNFGLSIRLPFEIPTNSFIAGDVRLISFRYFFTRKLMFMSNSNALAAFPGGFGTLDELFEVLTLQQTGKSSIIPVVLVEGEGGGYWKHWQEYVLKQLLDNGWISVEDKHLYYIAKGPEDAVEHIQQFYKRYHSSRYVKDMLVIRLNTPLNKEQLEILTNKYRNLLVDGEIAVVPTYEAEEDALELPRIAFHHTHRDFGLVRALIDDINKF